MRFAAKMSLPGTGWVAFKLLMDLVGLMMDLLGKGFLPRGSLDLFDFQTIKDQVCDCTLRSQIGGYSHLLIFRTFATLPAVFHAINEKKIHPT